MITFKLLLQLISNFPLYVTYGFKKYPLGLICLIVISLGILILSYWDMNIDLKSLKSALKKYIFLLVLLFLGQFFCCFITRINRFSRRISRYFKFRFNESLFLYWNMYNCCSLWISSVEKNKKWWFFASWQWYRWIHIWIYIAF